MNLSRLIFILISTMLVTQSCALFSKGSRSDFAIPGCEKAWTDITKAGVQKDLETLVVNDCSVMYQQGWRLPINNNTGGATMPKVCGPAWNGLQSKQQLDNVKFMITHNCPVFYRHKWIIPPK